MLAIIYRPYGTGLPVDSAIEVPVMTYMTTFRRESEVDTYLVKPGINLFPETVPDVIKKWLKGLIETDENVVGTKITATEPLAHKMSDKIATYVVKGLLSAEAIDAFMVECTASSHPKAMAAAKLRKVAVARLRNDA